MTRINLVDPSELTDQHLVAEYREIRLLTANIRRSFATSGPQAEKIPPKFTLNKSHVLFFKNKGLYIDKRYAQLIDEMVKRGFEPQHPTIDSQAWPMGFYKDWEPTEDDKDVVRKRIALRISQRPGWYRHNGKPMELAA